MNRLESAINSLNIENRFEMIMQKIELSNNRERISVPEAAQKSSTKTKDIQKASSQSLELKK